MEYRNLGRSGLKVSAVGLGCNNFGMIIDAAQTKVVVDKAIELGINFFDTADIYGEQGKSDADVITAVRAEVTVLAGKLMPLASNETLAAYSSLV